MFFKRNKNKEYLAFMSGKVLPLEEVSDPVFSGKMMGDGLAIEPTSHEVVSPIDGEITVVFPTKHAYGIKTKKGIDILIHLGIDTVELEGEGFESFVDVGDHIKAGDPLATMDLELIKKHNKPITSMMIFTSGEKIELLKKHAQVTIKDSEILRIV